MDENNKIKIAKMRSLIDRMETKDNTYNQGMINESAHINEAVGKNRVQVSRDEIIDVLNAQDEPGNGGKYASIIYVKPEAVYKTKRNWRYDAVTDALGKHADRSEEDWYSKLSGYNDPKTKGNNPIAGVVAVQRYVLHWAREENYKAAYTKYADELHNLRMKHGVGLDSDGKLGDNHNQREKSDYGTQFNQTGNLSKDFNTAGANFKSTCYVVNDEGKVISEIPDDVVASLKAEPTGAKPEKDVAAVLSGEALEAYMKAKAELNKTFKSQNFLFDRILCICATVNGTSYYYINDALKSPIMAKSEVYVDPTDMLKIAKEQIGKSFDVLQGFAI